MPEQIDKIVSFAKCKICRHYSKDESEDPCYDCLNNPALPYTRTPLHFEPRKAKKEESK